MEEDQQVLLALNEDAPNSVDADSGRPFIALVMGRFFGFYFGDVARDVTDLLG